jgi:hypothetical protein
MTRLKQNGEILIRALLISGIVIVMTMIVGIQSVTVVHKRRLIRDIMMDKMIVFRGKTLILMGGRQTPHDIR